jgi:aminomethyltransferase
LRYVGAQQLRADLGREEMSQDGTLRTPLYDLHVELGGKMVPFAGYDMPVQYPMGVLAEHNHTRTKAGLFDVSHMGQVRLSGANVVAALEALVPGDIAALAVGKVRYTMFTDDQGGILDDLMVTNAGDHLFMVVNAACKTEDLAHLRAHLGAGVVIEELTDRALLALQGPKAAQVLDKIAPGAAAMGFMQFAKMEVAGFACFVTRSGYTGEDGFEISVPDHQAVALARALLTDPDVAPIGLGARDSLRLEAGLCLYGSDIDQTTSPIEADLAWTISKRRREAGGFKGAAIILQHLRDGAPRKRVGIRPVDRAPARGHTIITDAAGRPIGEITSGGFGPTLGGPLAMGYVEAAFAAPGTEIQLIVRGAPRPAHVVTLPFVAHNYFIAGRK